MATVKQTLLPEEAQFLATAFPGYSKVNGSNFPVSGLAFDASTDEAAFWKVLAQNYGSGNLTLNLFWYADSASSGDVVWGCQIAAITPNADSQDVETDGLATAQTATDSHLGTTGQRVHQVAITISNLDSLAADDTVWIRIYRDADNGSDTMTGDAILLLAELTYSDT
jgi:hypothetical protein